MLNFNIICLGGQKNEYLLGYDEIVDIFFFFFLGGGGVITKLDYFWGLFLYILGLFLMFKVQNWIFFFFWGGGVCLIFLILFW